MSIKTSKCSVGSGYNGDSSMKPDEITGRLEAWNTQVAGDVFAVWGHVFDDVRGRFRDDTTIRTSAIPVSELPNLKQGYVVETRNSRYLLGKSLADALSAVTIEVKADA